MYHRYHSHSRRGLFSFLSISVIMLIGTVGMHLIEKMPWLDAFYFTSMIATAQGPMMVPVTAFGKIFASFLAFLSVGVVVGALGFFFGPFFGQFWHLGVVHLDKDLHSEKKVS